MGKGILVYAPGELEQKAVEFLQALLKHRHKSVALFAPTELLSEQDILSRLADKDEGVFAQMLDIYTPLAKEHDYVLVLGGGLKHLGELDRQIYENLARHLNLVVVQVFNEHPQLAHQIQLAHLSWERLGLLNPLSLALKPLEVCQLALCVSGMQSPNEAQSAFESLEYADTACLSPVCFQHSLLSRAQQETKTIVLPESGDERILKAAHAILQLKAAKLILLGEKDKVHKDAKDLGLDLKDTLVLDPKTSTHLDEFANTLYELRKAKGLSLEEAQRLVKTPTYFGTMLVHLGHAHGMVSGATHTTADTVRPALQIIKLAPGNDLVSSIFFMCLETKVYVFGDCAINPNPSSEELAQIALASAKTAKAFGFEPKVAMLSYSTGTSGKGPDVDKVAKAVQIAREMDSALALDGPLQFDASVDPLTGRRKMPGSPVAGKANVLIFPNLDAGNIAYKAVQRCAHTLAIGPVLQGLKKPVNDLSRGCLVDDVINTIIITAIQAQGL
ncbi:Phosphotransacetylase [Helicobacter sp. NHP19-003]|uniref:Phosphate acetyltransferase n=1 Tax=Helicobacter gastrocanis TaxID=2849641 RepID=A0ABN6I0Z0_9HELI|nr:phosphate acetyltransferase [Helicobacter sp. NHP19-003]BCZ17223.1 Phosphotransacetylase [Helicobacter sp. NHP19-003]